MANPWDALPDASTTGKKSGNPWDSLPDANQPSSSDLLDVSGGKLVRRHPSEMSDYEIATKLLKLSDQDAKWMMQSPEYRPGMLASGFAKPNDVLGKNNLGGTWIGSAAAGLRKGYNSAAQLIHSAAAKLPGSNADESGNTANTLLYQSLGKINQMNQNLNQGRDLGKSEIDPANMIGHGIAGESLAAGFVPMSGGARTALEKLGLNSARASVGAFATTPGELQDRTMSALAAAGFTIGSKSAADAGSWLLGKSKILGKTPSVKEMVDMLKANFGAKTPGQAGQDALEAGYQKGWSNYKSAVAPVDAAAPKVNVRLSETRDLTDQILNRAKTTISGDEVPAQLPYIESLNSRAAASMDPASGVTSTFDDVATKASKVGSHLRGLRKEFGDLINRKTYEDIQNALMNDMEAASPQLGEQAAAARKVFAKEVVPYFDTDITEWRTTPDAQDFLVKKIPGDFTRSHADEIGRLADKSGYEPWLAQMLDQALTQANGRPMGYAKYINKAMPVIERIAPSDVAENISNSATVAKTSAGLGTLANIGLGAAADAAGAGHGLGATLAASTAFNPWMTGQGLTWKALQNPNVRRLLVMAGKMRPDESVTDFISRISSAGGGSELVKPPENYPDAAY